MGVDYGTRKTGLSVTDPLQIIVNGLETVQTDNLQDFLSDYLTKEEVDKIVFGLPRHADGNPTYLTPIVEKFAKKIKSQFPEVEIDFQDESFTSKQAKEILLQSGANRKKRRDKTQVDKISAVLILQSYLQHI